MIVYFCPTCTGWPCRKMFCLHFSELDKLQIFLCPKLFLSFWWTLEVFFLFFWHFKIFAVHRLFWTHFAYPTQGRHARRVPSQITPLYHNGALRLHSILQNPLRPRSCRSYPLWRPCYPYKYLGRNITHPLSCIITYLIQRCIKNSIIHHEMNIECSIRDHSSITSSCFWLF